MIGSNNNDTLVGTNHADTIYGEDGDDLLQGRGGNDVLVGQNGADTLFGGGGDDYLVGGPGHNLLNGGSGVDWADFQDATTSVAVDLRDHHAQHVSTDIVDTFISIERLYGSVGKDTLIGNSADNLFNGAAGDDILQGGGGKDILIGGDGADNLDGGKGADVLQGGAGDDIYKVDNRGDQISEDDNGGTDTVQSSISYHLGDNLENLTLEGTRNIDAWGNLYDNVILGNTGDNKIYFQGGDTVDGGGGADTFVVTDFGTQAAFIGHISNGSVIDLSGIDADPTKAGDQAFTAAPMGSDGRFHGFTADGQYTEAYDGQGVAYIFHISDHNDLTLYVNDPAGSYNLIV